MAFLQALLGAVAHALVQLPAVFALGVLVASRVRGERNEWFILFVATAVLAAMLALLVTGITRPRTHRWRKGAITSSTSPVHSLADVVMGGVGCAFLWLAFLDPASPGFSGLFGWGSAQVAISLGLITLRAWSARRHMR